jgi:hypothetical protein
MKKRSTIRILSSLFFFSMILLPVKAVSPPQGVYLCSYTSDTITIDGHFGEAAWKNAPVLEFYVPPGADKTISRTEGRIIRDENYIYAGFRAFDLDIAGSYTKRDSPTYREDVLEFFILPYGKVYHNFEINALGTVYDAVQGSSVFRNGKKWDCKGLKKCVYIDGTLNNPEDRDRCWQLEIAVPLKELDLPDARLPAPGDIWFFHLARYDYSSYLPGGMELSSCAKLKKIDFHNFMDWMKIEFKE